MVNESLHCIQKEHQHLIETKMPTVFKNLHDCVNQENIYFLNIDKLALHYKYTFFLWKIPKMAQLQKHK